MLLRLRRPRSVDPVGGSIYDHSMGGRLTTAGMVALFACSHGSALAAPDAGRISYVGDADTYVTDAETFRYTGVGGQDPRDLEPTPSLYELRGEALYLMNADGSGRRRLTTGLPPDLAPRWSPDGERIVFTRDPAYGTYQLWTVDADGTGERRLTPDETPEREASWSPDGARIVFSRFDESTSSYDIYVRDVDGGGQRRLAHGHGWETGPAWSPDGTRIAFARHDRREGARGIYIVDADGGKERQVTAGRGGQAAPAWSPDGRKLAFADGDELWIVSVDGAGFLERKLADDRFIATFHPTWSADGREIAFAGLTFSPSVGALSTPGYWDLDIYAIGVDGTGLRRVTHEHGYVAFPDWEKGPLPPTTVAEAGACGRLSVGTRRADVLRGTAGGDRLEGRSGDDVLRGLAGDDCIAGQAGHDHLIGGAGADRLLGGQGNDRIDARDGSRDRVICGPGRDRAVVDGLDRVRGCERTLRRQ